MKKCKSSLLILFFSLALILLSCDKYHAKKMAGQYACKVEYHYWDISPKNIDSIYTQDIQVTPDGKNVIVLETRIHVDSLWKRVEYVEGYIHDYIKVRFKKDSVYITRSGGGLGGNASWTYSGLKIK